ncbi:class I SAM-dependent methyltransferase [Arthrobacter castelli]|uniref:class I SAM-dependent methyltransferase n=1 Tax=Arthrobacter castelli TaxID=271431 RepID=UPI0004789C0F|nr:class I SAM-dependent methyltransferase [Arthrobacter castelli]
MADSHSSDLYDAVNTWGVDDEFFLKFATSATAARVLDLGCGTGRVTLAVALAGCMVTGVDPDGPRLEAARAKPKAGRVEWIVGDSTVIPADYEFDAAIMSANVAQEILDDAELARSSADIAGQLVPGGRLAFDSRDPMARGWEAWTKERSHKIVKLPEGQSQHWYQTTHVDEANGPVEFCAHEVGVDGTENIGCDTLRFRSEEQLRTMLSEAGLVVDDVFGGFAGEPVGQGIGSLVITAHKP